MQYAMVLGKNRTQQEGAIMKKLKFILVLLPLVALVMGGCATYMPHGVLYVGAKGPVAAGTDATYSKTGKAEAQSILGLVATGDASIAAAAKNGGITKIKMVDWHVENILGIIGKYTTIVYGD